MCSAKHHARSEFFSSYSDVSVIAIPAVTEIQYLQRAVHAVSRSGELESIDLFCYERCYKVRYIKKHC